MSQISMGFTPAFRPGLYYSAGCGGWVGSESLRHAHKEKFYVLARPVSRFGHVECRRQTPLGLQRWCA